MSLADTTKVHSSPFDHGWGRSAEQNRLRAILELTVVLGLLLAALWTDSRHVLPKPARLAIKAAAIVAIATVLVRQWPDRRALGLAPESWTQGTGFLFLGTSAGCFALAGIGTWLGTLGRSPELARWCLENVHVDLLQQIVLQVFLVPRLKVLLPDQRTGPVGCVHWLAGLIFALLHLPNLPLVILTFIAGVAWAAWFDRYRNLPAVWLSHFLLASMLLYTLDGPTLAHLRVGIGYLTARSTF